MKNVPRLTIFSIILSLLLIANLRADEITKSPGRNPVVPPRASVDQLVIGDRASEAAHSCRVSSNTPVQNITTEIGTVKERYTVRTVQGKDTTLKATFSLPPRGKETTTGYLLEVEEIHNRQWQGFGYMVLVNGRETYFRTYEEQAAGPNHYFVKIDPALVSDPAKVEVTFKNCGGAPFRLARVWMYANFFALADQEQINQPLTIMGPGPFATPSSPDIRFGYFNNLCHIGYPYNRSYGAIDAALSETTAKNLPTELVLTAWFSSCPDGPDGRGGFFADPKYAQTVYRDGKLYPQYPNVWGNSFGYPSMTEPIINQFLDQTREDTCRAVQRRRSFMKAAGAPLSHLQLCSDVGPTYWDGDRSDFTTFELQAAARDGVRLDPNHLTPEARMWRHTNLSRVFARISDAFQRGVGRDSVLIDRGTMTLPSDQLCENLFTHPFFWIDNPVGDPRWRGWQTGVVDGMWTSGEMGECYRTDYEYVTARGKTGIVNMWSGGCDPAQGQKWLALEYQFGWRFSAVYGMRPEVWESLAKWNDISAGSALPPVHYERRLLDVYIGGMQSMGTAEKLVASQNVRVGNGYSVVGLLRIDPNLPASITYKLDTQEVSAGIKPMLYIEGRQMDKGIEIAIGDSPDALVPAATMVRGNFKPFGYFGKFTDMGSLPLPCLPNGKCPSYVKLTFGAGCIARVRVGIPWEHMTGHTQAYPAGATSLTADEEKELYPVVENWRWVSQHATDRTWSCKESRILNLWIQQRRMTERLLKQYRKLGGKDAIYRTAQALYEQGCYKSAYQRLIGELSQILPAQYAIRGHGQLGRYPVQVQLPTDNDVALVTLTRVEPDRVEFLVDVETPLKLRLQMRNVPAKKGYALERISENHYCIRLAPKDTPAEQLLLAVRDTLDVEVNAAPPAPAIPKRFTGICADLNGMSKVACYWPDNGEQTEWLVKIAPGSQCRRREVHATEWSNGAPRPGDLCTVTLNERGDSSLVESVYGKETGVIKSFERPGFTADAHAGILTLENGHRFEFAWSNRFGTSLDTALLQGMVRQYNWDMLAAGLRPGQRVELTYTPSADPKRPCRLLRIYQPTTITFEDKVGDDEAEWRKKPAEIANLVYYKLSGKLPALRNQSYTNEKPAYVVYKVSNAEPFGDTAVHIFGRTIIDERNKFLIYTSLDKENWEQRGEISAVEQLDQKHMMADLSACARGRNEFYLKLQIAGSGDWCTFWEVQVRTERAEAVSTPSN